MAKKKRINREKLLVLTAAAICIGFMATVTMFFPAVKLTNIYISSITTDVDGLHAVFGGVVSVGNENIQLNITEYLFNPLVFVGYLLPFVGVIFGVVKFDSKNSLVHYVSAGLCVLGAVLIFLEPNLFASVNAISDKFTVSLLIGPILGGILSLISAGFHFGCGYIKR